VGMLRQGGGSFIGLGEGHRGGEGGVTVCNVVVFNGRVISGSSRWVKARLQGGSNVQGVKEEGRD
jgi:hypothetical protein